MTQPSQFDLFVTHINSVECTVARLSAQIKKLPGLLSSESDLFTEQDIESMVLTLQTKHKRLSSMVSVSKRVIKDLNSNGFAQGTETRYDVDVFISSWLPIVRHAVTSSQQPHWTVYIDQDTKDRLCQ